MNIIDHAILIPASPDFIWRYLGDLSKNVDWQEDFRNISFLTTHHEGKGARWRYSTAKGHDVIVEIVAWYDTLGYEYTIVDGMQLGSNQGRIRLQEIPEGTRVQWTFHYETGGVLSSLRNSMGLKRNTTNKIQDSLRNLYQLIQQETGGISTHEDKASLKDAPDVEERSSYRPRHPSAFVDLAADDAYAESEQLPMQPIAYELDDEATPIPAATEDDTKPNPVIQAAQAIQSASPAPAKIEAESESPAPETASVDAPPAEMPTPIKHSRDTASISVFDVFGLQKPSQTKIPKVLAQPSAEPPPAPAKSESHPESLDDPPQIPLTESADEDAFSAADAIERVTPLETEPTSMAAAHARIEIQLSGWRRVSRRQEYPLRFRQ